MFLSKSHCIFAPFVISKELDLFLHCGVARRKGGMNHPSMMDSSNFTTDDGGRSKSAQGVCVGSVIKFVVVFD
jgi:hypothetical protein